MRMPGWCEGCHRVRQVLVSGHGLAMAAARGGVATGTCDECSLTPQDLIRESERLYGADLERRVAWLRNHSARSAADALHQLRNGRTR